MAQNFREPMILELAREHGKVTVEGLAQHFDVSVQTIRRDLSDLADAGKLERVHGGAVLPSGFENIGYDDRRALSSDAKKDIASRCAKAIPDGASLFLNIGTTTEAVARALLHHRDLLVITNNMNVANILVANAECQTVLTGGVLRRSDGGLVGDLAIHAVQRFKVDYAVIGCSALDQDGDIMDFDIQEVGVSQAIIRQARQTFLVADHSKFRRTAPARIATLKQIDCFFTDAELAPELQQACADWNTRLNIATT